MARKADSRDVLLAGDVSERAAAARDLVQMGTVDDVATLIERARNDKSPSVRLYAAAAAADLALMVSSTPEHRQGWVRQVSGIDPSTNPSLLMVLAAVPEAPVITRLGRTLRDPRYDVRAGAATALRRMATAARHVGTALPTRLSDAFRDWIAKGRHPADATLELVRITGEAGLPDLDEAISALDRAGRGHAEAIAEAQGRARQRAEASSYAGLWVAPPSTVMQWQWVDAEYRVFAPGLGGVPLSLEEGRVTVEDQCGRLIWSTRPQSTAPQAAWQRAGITLWQSTPEHVATDVAQVLPELHGQPEVARGVADLLEPVEGVQAKRLRAQLWLHGGDLTRAEELLLKLTDVKRPKGEDLWWLARVRHDRGETATARDAVERALAAAPKKCEWRDEALALQAALSA